MRLVSILRKNEVKKNALGKNQAVIANWWTEISTGLLWWRHTHILLKLAWIVTSTIQAYFRRIYLQSSDHNLAYISSPICTVSNKWTFFYFWMCQPIPNIMSQIWFLWRHHLSLFDIPVGGGRSLAESFAYVVTSVTSYTD